jgi:hypothetical protein
VATGALLCGPTVTADAGLTSAAITSMTAVTIVDLQTTLHPPESNAPPTLASRDPTIQSNQLNPVSQDAQPNTTASGEA